LVSLQPCSPALPKHISRAARARTVYYVAKGTEAGPAGERPECACAANGAGVGEEA
jgi:hypothetical protein